MDKQMVDKFFELVDSNGIGDDWRFVQISNVRAYFEECFNVDPPKFPFIGKNQKTARENVEKGEI